jgi:hypothetical protein
VARLVANGTSRLAQGLRILLDHVYGRGRSSRCRRVAPQVSLSQHFYHQQSSPAGHKASPKLVPQGPQTHYPCGFQQGQTSARCSARRSCTWSGAVDSYCPCVIPAQVQARARTPRALRFNATNRAICRGFTTQGQRRVDPPETLAPGDRPPCPHRQPLQPLNPFETGYLSQMRLYEAVLCRVVWAALDSRYDARAS